MRYLWDGSRSDRVRVALGLMLFTFWLWAQLNPVVADLGNPFAASVPVEMWFQHRLQWDPVIGCGTEMCR